MKEVKTTTIYTKERLEKFLEVYFYDKFKLVRIVLNILSIFLVIYFFRKNSIKYFDILGFIFCLVCVIELNTTMIPKLNLYRLVKRNDKKIDSKMNYRFNKNNFAIMKDKNDFISYAELYKVIETKDSFYLYINSSQVYIVSKDELNDDEIIFIRKNIREKVSAYISKNV